MSTHSSTDPLRTAELTGRLEAQIQVRIDEIAASIPRSKTPDDTAKFLATVRNANASTIRQAPGAAQRALAKTQKLDVGLAELVAIIEEDPTLTQALLRYANSAYYATGGPAVVSLKQAAQRIGMGGVHNVVLGSMVAGMLCKPGGEYQRMVDLVHEAFGGFAALGWSLGVEVAQSIATHHRLPIPERQDRMSELLFVAERVDHARQGVRSMELSTWWADGAIGGSAPEAIESILATYVPEELAPL